jgi:peptidoglycan/LPS O-acetylase OafA/YrhL
MTLVFVYHFGLFTIPFLEIGEQFAAPRTWGLRVVPNLNFGVEIFFVLSGYLIYGQFTRAQAEGRPRQDLRRYALRRFLRIYPAYWVALVTLLVRDDIYVNGAVNFLKHAALMHTYFPDYGKIGTRDAGIAISWTLVVEVSFYVFAPLWSVVARRLTVRRELWCLAALTLVGLGIRFWASHHIIYPALNVLLPNLAALAPGMMLAVVVAHRATFEPSVSRLTRRPLLWWAAGAATFFVIARVAYGSVFVPAVSEPTMLAWHLVLAPCIAVLLVTPIILSRARSWLRALLGHPIVAWIGTVSYGAYLWHHVVMLNHVDIDVVRDSSAFQAAMTMAGLYLFVLVLGASSWYGVERPSLRLADRLSRRSRPAPE